MKEKKSSKNPFYKYLAFVLVLISSIFLGLIYFIGVLPTDYFLLLLGIIALIDILLVFRLLVKGRRKIFSSLFAIILSIGLSIGIVYEINTIDFLKMLGATNYRTENYRVLALKNSAYENIDDLKNKDIGFLKLSEGNNEAEKELSKKVAVNYLEYDDSNEIKSSLLDQEVDAILLEETFYQIIIEEDNEFGEEVTTIYEFSLDIEIEEIDSDVDILSETFSMYISGIDTYGTINNVSRSDVNIIVTVNPNTHQILLTSIPRDYYVTLAGKGYKDKLTHAGIFGVTTSQKTIEELLDVQINYYVKVNFSSLVKIVDTLGGISVNSNYNFVSKDGYQFSKGANELNGEKALSFARERNAFLTGDRARGENQQAIIVGIVNKASEASITIKYTDILKALEGSFATNAGEKKITDFIKMQIAENYTWNIESISLNGTDAYEYTYTSKTYKVYVMKPDESTVLNAQNKISQLYED